MFSAIVFLAVIILISYCVLLPSSILQFRRVRDEYVHDYMQDVAQALFSDFFRYTAENPEFAREHTVEVEPGHLKTTFEFSIDHIDRAKDLPFMYRFAELDLDKDLNYHYTKPSLNPFKNFNYSYEDFVLSRPRGFEGFNRSEYLPGFRQDA
jgi:hypothetical protein